MILYKFKEDIGKLEDFELYYLRNIIDTEIFFRQFPTLKR